MEGFSVLVQVGTGPMKGHSWLEFEFPRVLNLAQSAPCLPMKPQKSISCLMKSIQLAARSNLF
jgi:hypothetical protein